MNYSILQKFSKEFYYKEPFPHIIIEDALPTELYEKILSSVPKDLIKNEGNNFRRNIYSNKLQDHHKDSHFAKFISYHESPLFYNEFVNIFLNEINQEDSKIVEKSKKMIEKKKYQAHYEKKFSNDFLLLDCCYGYNSKVEFPTSVRGPHLDRLDKIMIGLFYLKKKNEISQGGDLLVYKWNENIDYDMKKKLAYLNNDDLERHVEVQKTIKYKSNCLFLALNSLDTLHGVSIREKTSDIRQFFYFSFEFPGYFKKRSLNFLNKILLLFNFTNLKKKYLFYFSKKN